MHIIKLNAIDSTNTFLKEMVKEKELKSYTVVLAESQLQGRGQMGSVWSSEPGKNLTFSVFIKLKDFRLMDAVYLNYAVSLAIYEVLMANKVPKLAIKWPNDILAGNSKIGGLLIENSVAQGKIQSAIIGLGLNVNQLHFSNDLKNVASLKSVLGFDLDKEKLLNELLKVIQEQLTKCMPQNFKNIKDSYVSRLYKKEIPSMFKKRDGSVFLGKIAGVSELGELEIELEDGSLQCFGIKEVQFLDRT